MYFPINGLALLSIAASPSSQRRTSVQAFLFEHQPGALQLRDHAIAGDELALQDLLRQRVLDLRLNRALQWSGAVHGVEARLADLVARIVVQAQSDVALRQPLPQASQLYIHDGANLLAAQRV